MTVRQNDRSSGAARGAALLSACLAAFTADTRAQVVKHPIATDPTRIDSGLVAGAQLSSGVRAYFGIPYAAPPLHALRWSEPQPANSWSGIYNADRKAPECIQNLRRHDINHYFGEEATSEDCLYLNVWVPPKTSEDSHTAQKHPVIVWIYGGGFTIGSSGMANYDGEGLARKGVVFVSFNYRLGVLGFMAHPELTAQSPHKASGNYGFLDQVAALNWVRRNIAAFSGDADNVTIMGQSAGSMSVFSLQASSLTRGLFQRAVGMSGGPGLGPEAASLANGEQLGVRYQKALKAATLAELRQLPADRILAIQNACAAGACGDAFLARPIVDGYFLSQAALEVFKAGTQRDVPLLVGFTRDESWNELLSARTREQFRDISLRLYGDRSEEFLRLYAPSDDGAVKDVAADAVRDGGMASAMRAWARAQRRTGKSRVYMYVYSHGHPYAPGITFSDLDPATAGAYHASEIPFFLETLDALNLFRATRAWRDDDRRLSDEMSDCIVKFARTGDPATTQVPWPAYEPTDERIVEFGDSIRVATLDTARMNFMSSAHMQFSVGAPALQRRAD